MTLNDVINCNCNSGGNTAKEAALYYSNTEPNNDKIESVVHNLLSLYSQLGNVEYQDYISLSSDYNGTVSYMYIGGSITNSNLTGIVLELIMYITDNYEKISITEDIMYQAAVDDANHSVGIFINTKRRIR